MAQYESTPRTQFRRDVFLRCGDCGHVFINTTSSGTFCRRCRGGDLEVWSPGAAKNTSTGPSPQSRRVL